MWLGLATFSKPTHVLLMLPVLALFALRRQWRRGFVAGVVFSVVVVGFFAANVAITGDWNYQGGDRKTFYSGGDSKGFPFQTDDRTFDTTGIGRTTNGVPLDVLVSRDAIVDVFRHNLVYFFGGRHTGFAIYYFPGMAALLLFLVLRRQQTTWGWLTLAGGVGLGDRAAALHAVHLLGRRRPGGQSLLPRRLPGLPVPRAGPGAAVARDRRRGRERRVRDAGAEQPVLLVVPSRRAHQERALPRPAARVVAHQRPAGQREPVAVASAARRACRRSAATSWTTTPTTAKATRSGCAARAGPT